MDTILTERQQRELDYHRVRAKEHRHILSQPFSWEVLQNPGHRWWNAYWRMYAYLSTCALEDKRVLVVGCGFGDDALRLAKLGARVSGFDLSAESLQIARALAERESLEIDFREMPAERMKYPDAVFDLILARDILHHVDIPSTMAEICRVAKPGALFVVNEIYSHSLTDKLRHSALVEKHVYPRMRRLIYGPGKPYITEDERKLTERDVTSILAPLQKPAFFMHFNLIVTRLVPDRFALLCKLDQLILRVLRPFGPLLAGRILFSARIAKRD